MEEYKYTIEGIKYILKKVEDKLVPKIKQASYNRIIEYVSKTCEEFSKTRTLLHKDEIELSKIYVPLDISHKNTILGDIHDFIEKNNKITLIAKGGAGKTTLIKKVFIDSAFKTNKIPILFNFRIINEFKVDGITSKTKIKENIIFKLLVEHLTFQKISISEEIAEEMFDSGSFLFLFDGFDELKSSISTVIANDLMNFTKRFSDNIYLITSRPYTSAENFEGFENIYLRGLDSDEKKEEFIKRQFTNNKSISENIIKNLRSKDNFRYKDLLSNPLFLILFLNSYELYPKIPLKKTEFYWQVFNALYERHDNFSKLGYERPKFTKLNKDTFKGILMQFCFISYIQNEFIFKEQRLEYQLNTLKSKVGIKFKTSDFIKDLKISIPLLVEEGNNIIFVHRSIQEYFVCLFFDEIFRNENLEILEFIAKEQNIDSGKHTFLLELISEMYPIEFKKYYIKLHIIHFYERQNFYLNKHNLQSDYNKLFNSYEDFKAILFYCQDLKKPFKDFIESKNIKNQNINILISAKNKKQTKIAEEILILNENKTDFFYLIDNMVEDSFQSNQNIIDLAFNRFN